MMLGVRYGFVAFKDALRRTETAREAGHIDSSSGAT
jgi:hypothetical protein